MPTTTTLDFQHRGSELALALASVRGRLVLILALLGLVVLGWWWTASTMAGMDRGPWTQLGPLAFFLIVWTVMMYAMMFPSIAPTVALYARMTRSRAPALPVFFSIGYMLVWIGAGLLAYAVGIAASALCGDSLAWDAAGRHVAAVTLLLCAAYQLTSLKQACLDK
ncbi:MAG: DUF2182 domain-containing protein, partial [Salinisphaera sp.]|nr:DUF2182 domain-containing protein [Salinisphaera sp.]